MRPNRPPGPRWLLLVAVAGSVAIMAAVLLWVADVVPLGAMVGAVAVVGIGELVAVVAIQRRLQRQRRRTERLSSPGGTSTIDGDSPNVQYGYDPMDGLGPDQQR